MIFPELRRWFKEFQPDRGELLTLDLKGLSEYREESEWLQRNGFRRTAEAWGDSGSVSWSGQSVTRETALGHPVVYACNDLICGTIGYIPASLMQLKNGNRQDAVGHPMYSGMKNAPNAEISAQCFRETVTSHCVLDGGGFAKIHRRSGTGTAMELQMLLPGECIPDREKTGQKRLIYKIINEHGAVDKTYTVERGKPHEIFHLRGLGWNGVTGYSIIDIGRQVIGTALAEERNIALFWRRGGRVPAIIEKAKFKTQKEGEDYAKFVRETLSDPHKVPVFEGDNTYRQVGLSMVDSQALESRLAAVAAICRLFSVSPHLAQDLTHATFSNIENLMLQFEKLTLSRWLNRWRQSFWLCVLTPEEQEQGYYLHHNLNALLKGDFQTRMAGYATALQNGMMNIDTVQELEDRNYLPNGAGKAYRVQMNMQTVPGTGEPTIIEESIAARRASATAPAKGE